MQLHTAHPIPAPKVVKVWTGKVPLRDDFGQLILNEFIDGLTASGQWAIMTRESHKKRGVGLGMGFGQRYQKHSDGTWIKVEG